MRKMSTTTENAVYDEIRGIMGLLNKYANQTRTGDWLKLRRNVLKDKMGLWIDRRNDLIDLAVIEDALWDAAGRIK
jgi:hypothetical protein